MPPRHTCFRHSLSVFCWNQPKMSPLLEGGGCFGHPTNIPGRNDNWQEANKQRWPDLHMLKSARPERVLLVLSKHARRCQIYVHPEEPRLSVKDWELSIRSTAAESGGDGVARAARRTDAEKDRHVVVARAARSSRCDAAAQVRPVPAHSPDCNVAPLSTWHEYVQRAVPSAPRGCSYLLINGEIPTATGFVPSARPMTADRLYTKDELLLSDFCFPVLSWRFRKTRPLVFRWRRSPLLLGIVES